MSTESPGSAPARRAPTRSKFASEAERLRKGGLTGPPFCRAYADLVDEWFADLLGDEGGVALVAVGGYGRRELCPQSDVDVLLVHRGGADVAAIANRIWYPLWDSGIQLGHAVRTPREALALAVSDLDTATALLDSRRIAGDPTIAEAVVQGARHDWRKRGPGLIDKLAKRVESRHARAGEVSFLLEPDLKEGRGGLRDAHCLSWIAAAGVTVDRRPGLDEAYELLLSARVELHKRAGRATDRLVLQEQDAVAAALGLDDADALMARVAAAGRTIAFALDQAWRRARPPRRRVRAQRRRALGPGLELRDGEVALSADADLADPALVLRVAAAAAESGTTIAPEALQALAERAPGLGDPWPEAARNALVELLAAGDAAIGVIEALDQHGLLVRVLPEWEPVRHRPQRNAYHRYTVDRHLCEAAAAAAALRREVARPDLLVVGAWLHDIGKGYPGDHTEQGVVIVDRVARRMGFDGGDVIKLVDMVRHHLLLPDVATRRDLDDPATIRLVAEKVGDLATLELLDSLTEADSLATGPSAWSPWKAELVRELVVRVAQVLAGGSAQSAAALPTAEHTEMMAARRLAISRTGDELTVVAPDRPGLFARVAGTLALHGLDIVSAAAASTDDGMAVEVFRVVPALEREPDWSRLEDDLKRALAGRLALEARLDERVRAYGKPSPSAPRPAEARVLWDNAASEAATVVEVRASDGIGVLYRITKALADCDLDVRSAKVQTLGHEVVDTFYVRDREGNKIEEPGYLAELQRALLAALQR